MIFVLQKSKMIKIKKLGRYRRFLLNRKTINPFRCLTFFLETLENQSQYHRGLNYLILLSRPQVGF